MFSLSQKKSRHPFVLRAFLFFEGLTLAAGAVGGLLGGIRGFDSLVKPPLTPPAVVFPIVWTILYLAMGFAAYLVWNENDIDGARVLRMYLLQLAVNILWPFFFFRLGWRLFAFFWLLLLIALVTLTLSGFRYISKPAFYLMLPYLLWTLYAAYLNLGFYLLNVQ
ncbi:MAG TPA: tryptophan-rich sensory protein [Firmicutes bacterium]|nr:tryptophan-rich sensory protein [Bacillota bacterium]